MKNKDHVEGTLFPLEEICSKQQKKSSASRAYHHHKKGSSVNRLWMKLYPEPKRTAAQKTDMGRTFQDNSEKPK